LKSLSLKVAALPVAEIIFKCSLTHSTELYWISLCQVPGCKLDI
jgi:hypothetical protein